jgi:GT2 family glycosyltransferase
MSVETRPPPIAVVILTHNRVAELLNTVALMTALPESPPIIVVDNASTDGTAVELQSRFPEVEVISLGRNLGAAARNLGTAAVTAPYVAFCDDDTVWAPGSLSRAADLLDAHPGVAILSARVLVGIEEREDDTCRRMAESPLPSAGLPGRAVLRFLAGASVFRRKAFLEAGGYEPRFFMGGEEALMALDLLTRGWRVIYCPELTVRHYPSGRRNDRLRRKLLARNALWVAWLRRPLGDAVRESCRLLAGARRDGLLLGIGLDALGGLPWALRRRQVVPPHIAALFKLPE